MFKTFEARLSLPAVESAQIDDFAALWQQGLRLAWASRFAKNLSETATRPALSALGLTSNQIDSIFDEVHTRYQKLKGIKRYELQMARSSKIARESGLRDKERQLSALRKRLSKLQLRVAQAGARTREAAAFLKQVRAILADIETANSWVLRKTQGLSRVHCKITRLESELKSGRFSLCFGSAKLLRQDPRNANDSPFESVEAWRQAWADARTGHIYSIGRRREPSGNCEIQWDGEALTLKVRLPEVLAERRMLELEEQTGLVIKDGPLKTSPLRMRCRYLIFTDVDFTGYEGAAHQWLTEACATASVTGKLVRRRQADNSIAYYVQLSCDVPDAKTISTPAQGALGLDLNASGIAWSMVSSDGNRRDSGFEAYQLSGDTTARLTKVSQVLEPLLQRAQKERLIVAAESLDFSYVKASFKARGTNNGQERSYRRMLSGLPCSQARELLRSKCARLGLALYFVAPQYSSVGGWTKYGRINADGVDESAAHWIGRQALFGRVLKAEGSISLVKFRNERLDLPRVPQAWKQSKKGTGHATWQVVAQALGPKRSDWRRRLLLFTLGCKVGPDSRGTNPPRTRPSRVRTDVTGIQRLAPHPSVSAKHYPPVTAAITGWSSVEVINALIEGLGPGRGLSTATSAHESL